MTSYERRLELIARDVTLDNKRAVISGAKEKYARVVQLAPPHNKIEISWEALNKKINKDDCNFKS